MVKYSLGNNRYSVLCLDSPKVFKWRPCIEGIFASSIEFRVAKFEFRVVKIEFQVKKLEILDFSLKTRTFNSKLDFFLTGNSWTFQLETQFLFYSKLELFNSIFWTRNSNFSTKNSIFSTGNSRFAIRNSILGPKWHSSVSGFQLWYGFAEITTNIALTILYLKA